MEDEAAQRSQVEDHVAAAPLPDTGDGCANTPPAAALAVSEARPSGVGGV